MNETFMATKTSEANQIVKHYVAASMVAALIPIPVFDLIAITGIQLKLLHQLSKLYHVPYSANFGKSLIASLLGGVTSVRTGLLTASVTKSVPGLGTLSSITGVLVVGGASTYAIGKMFIQHFESGGTFLTFDPEAVRKHFMAEFERGKQVVEEFQPGSSESTGPIPVSTPPPVNDFSSKPEASAGTSPGLEALAGTSPGLETLAGTSPGLEALAGTSPGLEALAGTSPGLEALAGTSPGLEALAGTKASSPNSETLPTQAGVKAITETELTPSIPQAISPATEADIAATIYSVKAVFGEGPISNLVHESETQPVSLDPETQERTEVAASPTDTVANPNVEPPVIIVAEDNNLPKGRRRTRNYGMGRMR